MDIIPQYDAVDVLFYLDPPYVHSTRGMRRRNAAYRHEMNDDDHRALASVMHEIDGMAVISGYRCELYNELYGDWKRVDRESYADGAAKRIESLWLNPVAQKHGQQHLDLGACAPRGQTDD